MVTKLLLLIAVLLTVGCASRVKENPLEKLPAPVYIDQSCVEKPTLYSKYRRNGDCYIK